MLVNSRTPRSKTATGGQRNRPLGRSRLTFCPRLELLEARHMLSTFAHLDPGGPANLVEEVPVNIVFLGYEPSQINEADFRGWLPTYHDPIVVTKGERVGLHYTYDYQLTYADQVYEDAFFQKLTDLAVLQYAPANHTYYQELYNQQATNTVEIIQNYLIDAPSVEKWLAGHAPLGVDTTENTIFFVNWWGRSDFKFHVYMDNHDPVLETGFSFGNYEYNAHIAFGGTTQADAETGLGSLGIHRIWVHDLSAGPDAFSSNWNVDNQNLGILPPVWDYLNRFPQYLGGDLGVLTRFVAIDALFTASSWAPPYLTFPEMPASINLDINVYEGIKNFDASEALLTPDAVLDEVNELFRVPMTVDVQDLKYEGQPQVALNQWIKGIPHFKQHGNDLAYANLFYQEALNLDQRLDGGGEYEAVAAVYAVSEKELAGLQGISGLAATNYHDGTQSFVFAFVAPSSLGAFGLPATETLIHEYGHHFGLNHPHDGYDTGYNFSFSASTPGFAFVYTGTEISSVMSYTLTNGDFSQWDLDNFNRFWAAGYIKAANAIAGDVVGSPNAAAAQADLAAADAQVGLAQDALAGHDYLGAFDHARLAYANVRAAATAAGVAVVGTQIGRQIPPHSPGNSGHGSPLASPLRRTNESFSSQIPLLGETPFHGEIHRHGEIPPHGAIPILGSRSPIALEAAQAGGNRNSGDAQVRPSRLLDERHLAASDRRTSIELLANPIVRPGSTQEARRIKATEHDLALSSLLTELDPFGNEGIDELE